MTGECVKSALWGGAVNDPNLVFSGVLGVVHPLLLPLPLQLFFARRELTGEIIQKAPPNHMRYFRAVGVGLGPKWLGEPLGTLC